MSVPGVTVAACAWTQSSGRLRIVVAVCWDRRGVSRLRARFVRYAPGVNRAEASSLRGHLEREIGLGPARGGPGVIDSIEQSCAEPSTPTDCWPRGFRSVMSHLSSMAGRVPPGLGAERRLGLHRSSRLGNVVRAVAHRHGPRGVVSRLSARFVVYGAWRQPS